MSKLNPDMFSHFISQSDWDWASIHTSPPDHSEDVLGWLKCGRYAVVNYTGSYWVDFDGCVVEVVWWVPLPSNS